MGMKILVAGTHSFASSYRRNGIQHIAFWLGQFGCDVTYLSVPSSPLDLFGELRRQRFARVWRSKDIFRKVAPNVFEVEGRALVPITKFTCPSRSLYLPTLKLYPQHILSCSYDAAIFDVGPNFACFPAITAQRRVVRINDFPDRFASVLPRWLMSDIEEGIAQADEVWPVSEALCDWADGRARKVSLFRNGVAPEFFLQQSSRDNERAVFVGTIGDWVDFELVNEAASLLPGWEFDFYGPLDCEWRGRGANVHYRGVLEHGKVPLVLSGYAVGLLPYKAVTGVESYLECPLKAYEFAAVGLGIAASDLPGFKRGMEGYPHYGESAGEYARAIELAASSKQETFVAKDASWPVVVERMLEDLCL